jgi:hypothetical protein
MYLRALSVKVRALCDYVMVKKGKPVWPTYDRCTSEFWDGVEVYGAMACPAGPSRWHIMAGHWGMDYGGKHFEAVRIDRVIGITKEKNELWRGG